MAQTNDQRLQNKCEETIKSMSRLEKLVRSSFTSFPSSNGKLKKKDAEMMAVEKHVEVIRMVDDILDEIDQLKEMAELSDLNIPTDNRHTMISKIHSLKQWIRTSLATKKSDKKSVGFIGKVKKEEVEMAIERHCEVIEMVDRILDCIDKLNKIHANMNNQSQQSDRDSDPQQIREENSIEIEESVLRQAPENVRPTTAGSSTSSDQKKAHHKYAGVDYRKVEKNGKVGLQCMACSFFTIDYNQLYHHTQTIHQRHFYYVCDGCDYRGTTSQHLRDHLKSEHPGVYETRNKMKLTRQCSVCDFTTDEVILLVKHLKMTHGLTRGIHECDKCSFVTFDNNQFQEHRSVHLSADCVVCDQCGVACRSAHGLLVHTAHQHS